MNPVGALFKHPNSPVRGLSPRLPVANDAFAFVLF